MLHFVFPKPFEFYKFLVYLLSEKCLFFTILNITSKSNIRYDLILQPSQAPDDQMILPCYIIRDSDINFNRIFSELVHTQSRNTEDEFILIGSCGSNNKEDLGNMFYVKKAVKGDRGTLDKDSKFKIRKDKFTKLNERKAKYYKKSYLQLNKKICCSTNFLNKNIIDESFKDYIFDMETFDFYDICGRLNISNYFSIRFVTDLVEDLDGTQDVSDAEKCRRLHVNYDKMKMEKDKGVEKLGYLNTFKTEFQNANIIVEEIKEKIKVLEKELEGFSENMEVYLRLKSKFSFHFLDDLDWSDNIVPKNRGSLTWCNFSTNVIIEFYQAYCDKFPMVHRKKYYIATVTKVFNDFYGAITRDPSSSFTDPPIIVMAEYVAKKYISMGKSNDLFKVEEPMNRYFSKQKKNSFELDHYSSVFCLFAYNFFDLKFGNYRQLAERFANIFSGFHLLLFLPSICFGLYKRSNLEPKSKQ